MDFFRSKIFTETFVYKYKAQFLLVLLTFLFYGNTLFNDYALDDAIVITENKFTKQGIQGIDDLLFNESFTGFFGVKKDLVAGGRYRPLSMISFAIEYEIWGLNPTISHLLNVILYAITAIILFVIINILYKEKSSFFDSAALLISILFLAHPIHTEVVANIKGRDEIMSLLFSLLTLFYSIK